LKILGFCCCHALLFTLLGIYIILNPSLEHLGRHKQDLGRSPNSSPPELFLSVNYLLTAELG